MLAGRVAGRRAVQEGRHISRLFRLKRWLLRKGVFGLAVDLRSGTIVETLRRQWRFRFKWRIGSA